MNIPDYISPIVGYRAWLWGETDSYFLKENEKPWEGLWSLNGVQRWFHGKALEARCRVEIYDLALAGLKKDHDTPDKDCSCGIYATKNLQHLTKILTMPKGEYVLGEVFLWGKLWEHEAGYRAEYAYPKNIVLPPDKVPIKLCDVESRLESLIAYGVDIFIAAPTPDIAMIPFVIQQDIPLWTKASGFNQAGFDWIRTMRGRQRPPFG